MIFQIAQLENHDVFLSVMEEEEMGTEKDYYELLNYFDTQVFLEDLEICIENLQDFYE
jgi:hypothetical protein